MQTLILKDHPVLRDGEYIITDTKDCDSIWTIRVPTGLDLAHRRCVEYTICFNNPSVVEVKFGQRTLFQKIKGKLIGK